jgi:hypothetical protein
MNTNNNLITKFRFNLPQDQCCWIKNNQEEFLIPKEWSGVGKRQERWFQLEGENNKAHWVNYRQVFSSRQKQVLIKIWYKQEVNGTRKDYAVTVPKAIENVEVIITEQDEMIKKFDKVKNKEIWTNKSIN